MKVCITIHSLFSAKAEGERGRGLFKVTVPQSNRRKNTETSVAIHGRLVGIRMRHGSISTATWRG